VLLQRYQLLKDTKEHEHSNEQNAVNVRKIGSPYPPPSGSVLVVLNWFLYNVFRE